MMGPIIYHNHWAAFIEIALPLAIYYTLRSQSAALWLYSTMAATLYASVVISASRSGVIICTLELAAVPLLVARRHRMAAGVSRALAPLAGVLLLCTLIVGPEVVWNRLQEDPTLGRADWDRSSMVMFRDQMWHGFGLGNWPVVFPHYATFDAGVYVNQAHNDWLQWAVEGGVFYVGVFLALAWIAGRRGCRRCSARRWWIIRFRGRRWRLGRLPCLGWLCGGRVRAIEGLSFWMRSFTGTEEG